MQRVKEYRSGEIKVNWKQELWLHSQNHWHRLSEVFRPEEKPWIKEDEANGKDFKQQISQCPGGALNYRIKSENPRPNSKQIVVVVSRYRPYLLQQDVIIELPKGSQKKRENAVALCCGEGFFDKPYCNGSHHKINSRA